MTKLSGALPKGHGLNHHNQAMVDNPWDVHVVIALVDTKSVSTDFDADDPSPQATARVRQIEIITHNGDQQMIRAVLERAYQERTGQTVLPFELEQDVRAAFDQRGRS